MKQVKPARQDRHLESCRICNDVTSTPWFKLRNVLTLKTYMGYPQNNRLTTKNNSGPFVLPGGPNTIALKHTKNFILLIYVILLLITGQSD